MRRPSRSLAVVVPLVLCAGLALVWSAACAGPVARATAVRVPAVADSGPSDYPGLHNVVAYYDGFYSGGAPEGAGAFDTLAAMGVRTIISVDGAETEVEKAGARGMRYIHLPIGYNGFDEARKLELVRAVRDARREGPVYLHCHHGKHRSAGAAGAVAVSLGWMTNEQAIARMKVSGTAANYKGLYACTAAAGMIASEVVDAVPAEFPELYRPKGLVKGMVDADVAFENLRAVEKSGWSAPKEHPDLAPVAEAGKLADLLRLMESDPKVSSKPPEFLAMLRANAAQVSELEELLAGGGVPVARLSDQLKVVAASCKDCHARFRD